MKKQIIKFFAVLFTGAIFFYGCSASEVTEEYEGGQKDVTYQTEKPAEQPTTETQPSDTTTTPQYLYKVQVFAFESRLNAESEAIKIQQRMPDQQVYVEFQDNLYKVRLGTYSKWEHAKGIKDALYNLGYTDSFIVTEVKQ